MHGIALKDRAGCGRVLRDMEGVARAIFSSTTVAKDAEEAEIGAVKVLRSWSLQSTFAEIEVAKLKVGTVVFSLVGKNGNDMVCSLAMAGVNLA
ncbi:hypothetical protein J1N35_023840 [Gossypium stocksii]|uniref:Uncharacterized protein n=1 Tax=Gossypium stocksii TaxID=47602 RepID=A0A9D3VL06_9ROSI|nr:hypothetical protein J1N35_023840 [Gossypium stocksii]